jgi:glycine cleavage system H protein
MKKFTKQHEWIEVIDGIGTVGITDFAQHQLGDVIFIDLPSVGKIIKYSQSVAVVESVKAASDIYAPASGEVTEINEELANNPELVNSNSESTGWLFKVKLSDTNEMNELMTQEEYDSFIK